MKIKINKKCKYSVRPKGHKRNKVEHCYFLSTKFVDDCGHGCCGEYVDYCELTSFINPDDLGIMMYKQNEETLNCPLQDIDKIIIEVTSE